MSYARRLQNAYCAFTYFPHLLIFVYMVSKFGVGKDHQNKG